MATIYKLFLITQISGQLPYRLSLFRDRVSQPASQPDKQASRGASRKSVAGRQHNQRHYCLTFRPKLHRTMQLSTTPNAVAGNGKTMARAPDTNDRYIGGRQNLAKSPHNVPFQRFGHHPSSQVSIIVVVVVVVETLITFARDATIYLRTPDGRSKPSASQGR